MVSVAQWQSTGLWLQGLRVRVPPFTPDAPIAQLDRAPDFESVGREFESPWARQNMTSGYRVKGRGSRGSGSTSIGIDVNAVAAFWTLHRVLTRP